MKKYNRILSFLLLALFLAPALGALAQTSQPVISSFNPTRGACGTVVTIFGSNFDKVQSVQFNSRDTSYFRIISPTQIRATVPVNASTGPIRISTGTASATTTTNFTLTAGYVVTNTNDTNAGSLREGLLYANSNVDTTSISFRISGTGVKTISPLSALPVITSPVEINGYSQPGSLPNTNGVRMAK
ncbi:MAG TPA: IPT/TIG domain-containing protein, partial [Abditibacteriaceae bacterium]